MITPFIGTVVYFGFDWAPDGWGRCNGQTVQIHGRESLFKLIGITFGGDGKNTMGLPNLVGRSIVNQSDVTPYATPGGLPQVTIKAENLPPHTHTLANAFQIPVNSTGATLPDPANNYFAAQDGRENNYALTSPNTDSLAPLSVTVFTAGGSVPVNTAMPYLALNPCIAYYGIYPSRG